MGQLLSVGLAAGLSVAAAVTSVFVMRWVLSYVKNHSLSFLRELSPRSGRLLFRRLLLVGCSSLADETHLSASSLSWNCF